MDALQRRLKAIGEPRPAMRALQLSTIDEAKALVPRRTGLLQERIVPGRLSDTEAVIEARTPYASAVEHGSKPHRIPKSGNARKPMPIGTEKRLSGESRIKGGRVVLAAGYGKGGLPPFAMHVMHPGSKAHPYLVPGAKEAIKKAGIDAIVIDPWNGAA